MYRVLRNLTYFAIGVFLSASFLLGTTRVHAAPAVRTQIAATVHKLHDSGISCSAVMIAPERALTAGHCLGMVTPILTIEGVDYPVTEAYAGTPRDVALLIVPGAPCPCAPISDTPPSEGDWVAAVGYPWGMLRTVTYGEVQGRVTLDDDGQDYLFVTALVAPGNSGGGLFNEYGELVGLTVKGVIGHSTLVVETLTVVIENPITYPRK